MSSEAVGELILTWQLRQVEANIKTGEAVVGKLCSLWFINEAMLGPVFGF